MLGRLLRAVPAASAEIIWIITYIMAVYAVIVTCIVITMRAALRAKDPGTREVAYRMFRDLLAKLGRR